MGEKAEKRFGKKNFLELYAVFSTPSSTASHAGEARASR